MKHFIVNLSVIAMITILYSCGTTQILAGRTYKMNTKRRTFSLIFDNDTVCRYINTFHCKDTDPLFNEITITCNYTIQENLIILKNKECESDSCYFNFIVDIPVQNCKKCTFLNEQSRKQHPGPSYLTDYEKYGYVPNIDIDTLHVIKRKLIMAKENLEGNMMYILTFK